MHLGTDTYSFQKNKNTFWTTVTFVYCFSFPHCAMKLHIQWPPHMLPSSLPYYRVKTFIQRLQKIEKKKSRNYVYRNESKESSGISADVVNTAMKQQNRAHQQQSHTSSLQWKTKLISICKVTWCNHPALTLEPL